MWTRVVFATSAVEMLQYGQGIERSCSLLQYGQGIERQCYTSLLTNTDK